MGDQGDLPLECLKKNFHELLQNMLLIVTISLQDYVKARSITKMGPSNAVLLHPSLSVAGLSLSTIIKTDHFHFPKFKLMYKSERRKSRPKYGQKGGQSGYFWPKFSSSKVA